MIKSERMRWAGNIPQMGEKGCAYKIFLGKSEGKRLVERPIYRREDNVKMYVREMG
jgi:hypothetical protein